MSLESIKKPVTDELDVFEERFRDAMRSNVPLLDKITWYIVQRKGKQVRPMLVLLSARIFGPINEGSYTAASMVELLHTATLVHDDVVDDSNERRGFFSINALWKNKVAVLVGDFLLSQGLLLSVKNQQFRMLELVSRAVKEMAEGELLQMEKARRLDIKEEIYHEIIRQKTASLIAAACCAGAVSTAPDEESIQRMWKFGEKTGMAFQIRDDLFDFGDDDVGKPLGIVGFSFLAVKLGLAKLPTGVTWRLLAGGASSPAPTQEQWPSSYRRPHPASTRATAGTACCAKGRNVADAGTP